MQSSSCAKHPLRGCKPSNNGDLRYNHEVVSCSSSSRLERKQHRQKQSGLGRAFELAFSVLKLYEIGRIKGVYVHQSRLNLGNEWKKAVQSGAPSRCHRVVGVVRQKHETMSIKPGISDGALCLRHLQTRAQSRSPNNESVRTPPRRDITKLPGPGLQQEVLLVHPVAAGTSETGTKGRCSWSSHHLFRVSS